MARHYRVPFAGIVAGTCELDARTSHYVQNVLRIREGDTFLLFDPHAKVEANASIAIRGALCTVICERVEPSRELSLREVHWIQGFPRGEKADTVVRQATELGVARVVLAITARSTVRLDDRKVRTKVERFERIAEQAARQCGRSGVPQLEVVSWSGAMEHAAEKGGLRVCFFEGGGTAFGPLLMDAPPSEPVVCACGPEGGLTAEEVFIAVDAGFQIVTLGELILRTETVAPSVLGAIRAVDSYFFAKAASSDAGSSVSSFE